jgi:hypothetical protein
VNWNVQDFSGSAPIVEFENTNYLGSAKKLSRLSVPNGGLLFPAYDLNHSYVDCDVFVSIAKCKDHGTTGVSTVLKNQFGLTPLLAYGNFAGQWEDNDQVTVWFPQQYHAARMWRRPQWHSNWSPRTRGWTSKSHPSRPTRPWKSPYKNWPDGRNCQRYDTSIWCASACAFMGGVPPAS